MLDGLTGQNSLLLLLAVAGFWFAARFIVGPKRGAPGLGSMFKREKVPTFAGLGREAIATLLDDTRRFVVAEPGLRGAILAGPFTTKSADSRSTVTFIVLADALDGYAGADWLARWPYPNRGHVVLDHDISADALGVTHTLNLRGAPPLRIRFELYPSIHFPAGFEAVLVEGSEVIEDPTGQVDKLRRAWQDQIDRQGAAG